MGDNDHLAPLARRGEVGNGILEDGLRVEIFFRLIDQQRTLVGLGLDRERRLGAGLNLPCHTPHQRQPLRWSGNRRFTCRRARAGSTSGCPRSPSFQSVILLRLW